MTIGVPSRKKSQVFRFFLPSQDTSAVRTPPFGLSEARFDVRGVTMLLIDQKGSRVRPVCRECRELHAAKECPRRKSEDAYRERIMQGIRVLKAACR
jgi:hypothetical protein